MTKTFCDFCGNQTKYGGHFSGHFSFNGPYLHSCEACEDATKAFWRGLRSRPRQPALYKRVGSFLRSLLLPPD